MTPRRLCETCRVNRVKGLHNKFCSPQCVPKAIRQANCRKGRKTWAYTRRNKAFRDDLERLTREGRRITREDLLDVFQVIYKRAYNSGFQCGRSLSLDDEAIALAAARERGAA